MLIDLLYDWSICHCSVICDLLLHGHPMDSLMTTEYPMPTADLELFRRSVPSPISRYSSLIKSHIGLPKKGTPASTFAQFKQQFNFCSNTIDRPQADCSQRACCIQNTAKTLAAFVTQLEP